MRERDLDLYLLARRNTAMKCPSAIEHSPHQRFVLVRDRIPEFAAHQEVREIGKQAHLRNLIHQVEREEEIRRHPVAMRFEVDYPTLPGC
ncbi:hypothetical protein [Bradyrhizobium japonicum]|uniref:hypothetical protein n=1 Tax=Bradyrhizobium japonicum TaxID=375 RepID=UPI0012FD9B1F|nr:hypothetical protein [Bradyrhizobium japonicum]